AASAHEPAGTGRLDGPVLIFGGPYSNLDATEALIALAGTLAVPPGRAICTGDVAAYCADPQATTDALREWGCPVLMGNCQESLGTGARSRARTARRRRSTASSSPTTR